MRKYRVLKILLIVLVVAISGIYLFVRYDNRHFLTSGVLLVKEKSPTLKIIRCESFGLSDFRMEYYVIIDKSDIAKLLQGRQYNLTPNPDKYFMRWATGGEKSGFKADVCYTSGSISKGLVNIFLNKDKSAAYIVYDVK